MHFSRNHIQIRQRVLFMLLALLLLPGNAFSRPTSITGQLQRWFENRDDLYQVADGRLSQLRLLRRFYRQRGYRPAWVTEWGPGTLADELLEAVSLVHFDGLDPADYHHADIKRRLAGNGTQSAQKRRIASFATLDLLLSDAFLNLGRHLQRGKVEPADGFNAGIAGDADTALLTSLTNLLMTHRIYATLERLKSDNAEYRRLRTILARYLRIAQAGGWKTIPDGKDLKRGDSDERIPAIRHHLKLTGDLTPLHSRNTTDLRSPVFDGALESAIRRFQWRHDLRRHGRLDWRTRLAMNVPVRKRILQIRLNMDLRRRLPDKQQNPFILVNIPDMSLQAIRNGRTELTMRVIVGKPEHPTPVFSDDILFLVVNPYWYIPPEIVKKEILPLVRKDPGYLAVRGIRLFRKMSADGDELLPNEIDWAHLDPEAIDFYFRQDPGWDNSLGAIKFVIPHRDHIYLHDTPARELFKRRIRTLSFGCIRVEHPLALAAFMLTDDPDWTRATLNQLIQSGQPRKITLPRNIAVHVVYWTLSADNRRSIRFLPDVYDLEDRLIGELME